MTCHLPDGSGPSSRLGAPGRRPCVNKNDIHADSSTDIVCQLLIARCDLRLFSSRTPTSGSPQYTSSSPSVCLSLTNLYQRNLHITFFFIAFSFSSTSRSSLSHSCSCIEGIFISLSPSLSHERNLHSLSLLTYEEGILSVKAGGLSLVLVTAQARLLGPIS